MLIFLIIAKIFKKKTTIYVGSINLCCYLAHWNLTLAIIKLAEETNQTDYIFQQLSEQYSQEGVQQSKVLTSVLEHFIIFFVGVLVAVLLAAMYLPMFQLGSVIN